MPGFSLERLVNESSTPTNLWVEHPLQSQHGKASLMPLKMHRYNCSMSVKLMFRLSHCTLRQRSINTCKHKARMLSRPKKANDTHAKTSTNPASKKEVAAVETVHEMASMVCNEKESQTVDQKTIEKCVEDVTVMDSVGSKCLESESADDRIILES
ncbi:hypothetical protein E3N88_18434 [Mikania micrantha]|uniref:Uncharacterized protein n=1 Tax=Mikania micrantha TaxID=192012 RepID=A0A5N6NN62_9ASTR|nr:hypothetical protein E3N88_18434 [Mikania micrantha]